MLEENSFYDDENVSPAIHGIRSSLVPHLVVTNVEWSEIIIIILEENSFYDAENG